MSADPSLSIVVGKLELFNASRTFRVEVISVTLGQRAIFQSNSLNCAEQSEWNQGVRFGMSFRPSCIYRSLSMAMLGSDGTIFFSSHEWRQLTAESAIEVFRPLDPCSVNIIISWLGPKLPEDWAVLAACIDGYRSVKRRNGAIISRPSRYQFSTVERIADRGLPSTFNL